MRSSVLSGDAFVGCVFSGLATRLLSQMEGIYDRILPFAKGEASYYNYADPNLPLETPYFSNGVELNPGISISDERYWIERLRRTKSEYNPLDMLGNPLGIVGTAPAKEGDTTASDSSGAHIVSGHSKSVAFAMLLVGCLLFHSSQHASYTRHNVRWRRKKE